MPLVHYDTTGQTLYARFDDGSNTAVNLTEGTTLNLGRYTAADAAIVSAGLAAGTYTGRIFVGTAGAQSSSDYQIGSFGGFVWSGSVETVDQPQTGDAFARLGAPAGASVSADLATIVADTNELQGDWVDGGRLDLLLDAKATSAEVTATTDDRDLEPVQHEWRLKRSGSSGVLRSTNPLYLHPGDGLTAGIRAGWDCTIPAILPTGSVLSTMTTPTSSDDTAGVNVVAKLGIDGRVAKVQLSADADAAVGSYWITTQVTNSFGGGPITIYGEVVVQAAP